MTLVMDCKVQDIREPDPSTALGVTSAFCLAHVKQKADVILLRGNP